MNKVGVLIGAVAGVGGLLWIYHSRQAKQPTLGIPSPANLPNARPRVDNQSQPWYAGATNMLQSKALGYQQNPALAQKDLTSVVHSASDVWGMVSGFFGKGDTGTAENVDDTPFWDSEDPTAQDGSDLTLTGSDYDQSNMIGDQFGDYSDNTMDVAFMGEDSSDSNWGLDYSDSDNWSDWGSDNYDVA